MGCGKPVLQGTAEEAASPPSPGSPKDIKRDWELRDELRARRHVDFSVLPLLVLGFLMFQLDRMNLASALTAGFAKDIAIDQDTVNLGNQLMYMGTVVFEIPCNLALQRIGPRKWMAMQVLLFGLVSVTQVFIRDKAGFLTSRLILGFAESGYIPGSMYTLSTWYIRRELARRIAIFFFGMFGGNAISPLLATGILKMDGIQGLKGWQWLFLLEGMATIFLAILFMFLLPGSPDSPRPLCSRGIVRISPEHQEILQKRIEADDAQKVPGTQGLRIPLWLVGRTLKHWRRWPHFVATFCLFSTWSPLTTYQPSITMALGFDRTAANALSAVGAALALLVIFGFAWVSDRTNRRGAAVIVAQACFLVALIVARESHDKVEGRWARWGLWTAVNAFSVGYHPIHNTWLQLNCREPGERSVSIAMWVMSSITGLAVGSQYFRGDDLPFYDKGLRTMIIIFSVGMMFTILQVTIYTVHNRHVNQGRHTPKYGVAPMIYVP